jgi:hypothetical protein
MDPNDMPVLMPGGCAQLRGDLKIPDRGIDAKGGEDPQYKGGNTFILFGTNRDGKFYLNRADTIKYLGVVRKGVLKPYPHRLYKLFHQVDREINGKKYVYRLGTSLVYESCHRRHGGYCYYFTVRGWPELILKADDVLEYIGMDIQ